MCLVWGEDSLGTDQMGQPKADWAEFLYPLNGLLNGKEAPNLSWIITSQITAQFC